MQSLLIRGIPKTVGKALAADAERHRRSREKHALFLIEQALESARQKLPVNCWIIMNPLRRRRWITGRLIPFWHGVDDVPTVRIADDRRHNFFERFFKEFRAGKLARRGLFLREIVQINPNHDHQRRGIGRPVSQLR